jgi:hypothetical protein
MNRNRTLVLALIVGLCLALAAGNVIAAKGGNGGGKPGGGGDPSPLDALPGTLVYLINPSSSDDAWHASDPNGGNRRLLPIASDEGIEAVSVSPYPIHIIVKEGATDAYSVRPLESSGPGVALFAHLAPYWIFEDSVRFLYRDPDGGHGSEIDAVAFWGYDPGNITGLYYYYSADLIRDAQGNVTGLGAITQLAATPSNGGGPAPSTGPDGLRVAYGEGGGTWPYLDTGLVTYDITTGIRTSYPDFDAQTCERVVLWSPAPDSDLWAYELKACHTSDCRSAIRELVVADVAAGTTNTILTGDQCFESHYGMAAWSPDGTYLALSGPGNKIKRGAATRDVYLIPADGSADPVRVVSTKALGRALGEIHWGAQISFGN